MRKLLLAPAALSFLLGAPAYPAALLPNGMQQYVDGNGQPYGLGSVCYYIPNTSTPKQTWQDPGATINNTSPCITLDTNGRAVIYGNGQYRQKLFDVAGNQIWDKLTQGAGGGNSGGVPTVISGSTSIGACNGGDYSIDNSSAALVTITLPTNPASGDACYFFDSSNTAATYPIVLNAGVNSFVQTGSLFAWSNPSGSWGVEWIGDVSKWAIR